MIAWFKEKLWHWFGYDDTVSPYANTSEALTALMKALECGGPGDSQLRQGSALAIEPLPGWMFNGEPEVVMRKSDGQVFDVCVSSYNKELHGEEVTIKENGEYITLLPGEFTVVTSHYEPMP